MNDDTVIIELFLSMLILIWATGSFLFWVRSRQRRMLNLPLVAFWVAGFNISVLPLAAYLVNPGDFNRSVGWETNQLYASFFLFLLGIYSTAKLQVKPHYDIILSIKNLVNNVSSRLVILAFIFLFLSRGVDFFVYGGGLSGLGTLEYQLNKPYIFFVIQSIVAMVRTAVLAWLFYRVSLKINWIFLATIVEIIYTFFFMGRGELFIFLLLFFFVRYLKSGGVLHIRTFFVSLVIFYFIFVAFFPAFLSFRDGYVNLRDTGRSSSELFKSGLDHVINTYEIGGGEGYQERLGSRLLGTDQYLRDMLFRQRYMREMSGEATIAQASVVIPRILWPSKPMVTPKVIVENHYQTSYGDPSTTTLSTGIADFGVIGAFIAGLFVGLFFHLAHWIGRMLFQINTFVGAIVTLDFFYLALHYEVSVVSYFALFRNALLIYAIAVISTIIFRARSRRNASMRLSYKLKNN